ncbi:hypothetical protein GGH96_006337, partial [Coemansia sp. RSA 1972]
MRAMMVADAAISHSSSPEMSVDSPGSSASSTPSVYVEVIIPSRRADTSELVPEVSVLSEQLSQDASVLSEQSQIPSNVATPLLSDTHSNAESMHQTPPNNRNVQQRILQRATSSPTKVHGNIINVSGDFGTVSRHRGIVLDKSLLCKALFDTSLAPIRVCLPRRFGKTFNLSVIEEFFNVVTCKDAEPVNGSIDEAAGRANRMELFKDSILRGEHPEFFEEHFCKTPVIRITMKIELGDLGSGPNNIMTLALTVLKPTHALNENARIMVSYDKFGELFAFTQPNVEALVEKVLEKNPHIQEYSVELIMSKIIEWYDGYCFGVSVGKPPQSRPVTE